MDSDQTALDSHCLSMRFHWANNLADDKNIHFVIMRFKG